MNNLSHYYKSTYHHHHLFLKRLFLIRSARVRRLSRYQTSPHIMYKVLFEQKEEEDYGGIPAMYGAVDMELFTGDFLVGGAMKLCVSV